MTTAFGEKMRMVMGALENQDSTDAPSVKKRYQPREKVVEYTFDSSGVDMVVTRVLNGKETKKLIVYLSRETEDGRPVFLFEDKGTYYDADDKKLMAFLDGADTWVKTGCMSVPRIKKDKEFFKALRLVLDNNDVRALVKMGILDTDLIMYIMGNGSYSRTPWYCYEQSRYYREDTFREMYMDNIHLKMVKWAIGYNIKKTGCTYQEALKSLYSTKEDRYDEDLGVIKSNRMISNAEFKAFVVLANRYDEPFAVKCMEDYMEDDNLDGISWSYLDDILRIKTGSKCSKTTYSGVVGTLVGQSLLYGRLRDDEEKTVLNFDKNSLWEYILSSTIVGRGKKLDDYLSTWKDYLAMTMDIEEKVRDKYPQYLKVAHDIVEDRYEITKDTRITESLMKATEESSKICDVEAKGWQLRVLRTASDFYNEKVQQSNCVASYVNRCIAKETIVASARPKDSETTVITVEISPGSYEFIQMKGRFNRYPTKEENEILNVLQEKVYDNLKKIKDKEMKALDEA